MRRRHQRENDAPAIRAALLGAIKLGTTDALDQAFPDNETQQEQVRASWSTFQRRPDLHQIGESALGMLVESIERSAAMAPR